MGTMFCESQGSEKKSTGDPLPGTGLPPERGINTDNFCLFCLREGHRSSHCPQAAAERRGYRTVNDDDR